MIVTVMIVVICFLLGCAAGAVWRDGRAIRTERELESRIKALTLVGQASRQELSSMYQHNGLGRVCQKILRSADEYTTKIEASRQGTFDYGFNRGVRHGLRSAVILIRGWL